MGKNKNDKKSPAAKKAAPETAEANNADMLNTGYRQIRNRQKT